MHRRDFIRKSCSACLSVTALAAFGSGCAVTKYVSGSLGKDGLTLSADAFKLAHKTHTAYSSFVIVRNDALQYPICVYRVSGQQYSALWMKCSHQGAELQASGDVLQCPAHGSEFDNRGAVTNGPASDRLRAFPVTVMGNDLFIDLRKQS